MAITYDPAKREWALAQRGLDFEDAAEVLADPLRQTDEDIRRDYGERRFITVGHRLGRLMVIVWTPRGDDEQRIISMRKANAEEQKRFADRLGEG